MSQRPAVRCREVQRMHKHITFNERFSMAFLAIVNELPPQAALLVSKGMIIDHIASTLDKDGVTFQRQLNRIIVKLFDANEKAQAWILIKMFMPICLKDAKDYAESVYDEYKASKALSAAA